MTPESILHGVFSHEEVCALRTSMEFVNRVPELSHNLPAVRSHELARAVAKHLAETIDQQWSVVDGKYGQMEHTWLVSSVDAKTILDVFCPARVPEVQLVSQQNRKLPEHNLFEPGVSRTDVNYEVVEQLVFSQNNL